MKRVLWWAGKLMIPVSMILLGLAGMHYGQGIVEKSYETVNWPSTQGEITYSRLKRTSWTSDGKTEVDYSADIRYRYWIGGKEYTDSDVRLVMPNYNTPEEVQTLLDRYPEEKQVTVYYNPGDLEDAVLENVVDEDTYVFYYMGVGWSVVWGIVLPIFIVAVYFREVRKKRQ